MDIPPSSSSLRVEPPSQDLPIQPAIPPTPSPTETVASSIIPSTTNSPSVDLNQPMLESDQLQLSEDSDSGTT